MTKPTITEGLVITTVLVTLLKFALDGVIFSVKGYSLNFGHIDSLTYCSVLAPVLATHGYLNKKALTPKADNPDA